MKDDGLILMIARTSSLKIHLSNRSRPYHVEYTSSRPIAEVKQPWAELVLRWVTTWEASVLSFFFLAMYISAIYNLPSLLADCLVCTFCKTRYLESVRTLVNGCVDMCCIAPIAIS